jgi:hypothetical protein
MDFGNSGRTFQPFSKNFLLWAGFFGLFIPVILSVGCKNYICSNNQILTAFVGIDQNNFDSFVLRRYKANDNYQTLIDSFLVINSAVNTGSGNAVYTPVNDSTIVVYVNNGNPGSGIFPGYDWQLYIPALDLTSDIFNIVVPQTNGVEPCNNPVLSYMQDSTLVSSPYYPAVSQQYASGYWIYISP